MFVRILALLLFSGILIAGCDSAEDPPPELQGRYDGTFTYIAPPGPFSQGGEVSEAWSLSLTENGSGDVSGTGTLTAAVPVSVAGTHDHPDVVLTFTDDDGGSVGRFTGKLSDDGEVLDGVYDFNLFFANDPVTLTRVSVTLFAQ